MPVQIILSEQAKEWVLKCLYHFPIAISIIIPFLRVELLVVGLNEAN